MENNIKSIEQIEVHNPQILNEMNIAQVTEEKPTETIEQLEARLEAMKLAKNEQKEKARKDYENLKHDTVLKLCTDAIFLNAKIAEFKERAFSDMQTVWSLLQEYSARHKDGKGSFKIESGIYRVSYKQQGKASFDERSHQAEKHIIDFVNSKFEDDEDTRDLVMSLLERKKDELDINLVQKLYAMENRFSDENWTRGIELLKESYSYNHSKDYIRFEHKTPTGAWEPINLQFSNV